MVLAAEPTELTLAEITSDWLDGFADALRRNDSDGAAALFLSDGHWRDLLSFTWHIQTASGTADIAAGLQRTLAATKPHEFHIPSHRAAPRLVTRAGVECIEAIIAFETATGPASGILRLVSDDTAGGEWRAWVLLTALDDIRGHEERTGSFRPDGEAYSREFGGENWADLRRKAQAYEDHEPDVLVIGGGQAGLGIAACLGQLGVDALVIDRHERIGDAWRKRYHSLTLHNQVHVNHLPYMPFPPNWPLYIPKDKLANWFEAYADSMELNVWTGTEVGGGSYDEQAGEWQITLARTDGSEIDIRPRHVVFATGVSGIPIHPELPGLEDFAGSVVHSGAYTEGHEWNGRKALVLGTGNSGHDVAQDLHASGADVTMIQRGTSLIVSLDEAQKVYSVYDEGPSLADCDLLATASPYPVLVQGYKLSALAMQAADKDLLDGLSARGFRHDIGPPDNTGFQMKYLRQGGGYCLNVGCSELIIDGEVGLMQYDDIEQFVADGVRLKDGTIMQADLIVTATGYKNQQEVVRATLGDDVADKVGPVWGFDDGGELRNMWRRTAQPGLWFTAGGLPHVRIYSKYLAMQIKATDMGKIEAVIPAGS
ncbi:MAG: NAD(P)/FAD-dependent oxidoreductase [Rhodospirillaceae bacterium]|nr:NAD(P)/FAD-dependent oxidoreductase [Rhodospirillaceae bacterium]MBT5195127.1 NAD(P)/FAD-dependent oxidoreductase [Rhodospirillaceae bacterium]MBT5895090.1 NAD(P)/FAD-dependent oxidoreductase [Rhodospirillaceae bacterium]MBT6431177.1 NAD(P)/FAD-dependent oxidoreductase [Rhodospirillaceae bacterium]